MLRRTACMTSLLLPLLTTGTQAQPGIVTSVASGYAVTTIPLPPGARFQGAFGNHATNPDIVVIFYNDGTKDLIGKVNLSTSVLTPLVSDTEFPLVFIGGCALLSDTELVWTDNAGANEDVFVAVDADINGFQTAEVASLTAKGLNVDDVTAQVDFTGSKVRVIPANGIAGLQAGDVLIQTADDNFLTVPIEPSEVFVIRGITGPTPAFIPVPGVSNAAFFRGTGSKELVFDGGLAFGPNQSLIVGSGLSDFSSARIIALRDVNTDGQINEATEANHLGDLPLGGIYELAANNAGQVFTCSGGNIKSLQIDLTGGNILTAPAITTSSNLVQTTSFFLAGVYMDNETLPFAPFGNPATSARLVFADFDGTELYIVQPALPSAVAGWMNYE